MTVTYEAPAAVPAGAAGELHAHVRARRRGAHDASRCVVERGAGRAGSAPCAPASRRRRDRRRRRADDAATPTACAADRRASASVGVGRSRARRCGSSLAPRAGGAATVSVFQQSSGRPDHRRAARRALHEPHRLVHVERAPKAGCADGYYFVRYRLGKDTRRVTLRRTRRAVHARRRLLPARELRPGAELQAHAAGVRRHARRARSGSPTGVAKRARVTVTVLRGSQGGQALRRAHGRGEPDVRLSAAGAQGLARGDYKVRLVARAGSETVTSTLMSRRL